MASKLDFSREVNKLLNREAVCRSVTVFSLLGTNVTQCRVVHQCSLATRLPHYFKCAETRGLLLLVETSRVSREAEMVPAHYLDAAVSVTPETQSRGNQSRSWEQSVPPRSSVTTQHRQRLFMERRARATQTATSAVYRDSSLRPSEAVEP